MSRAHHSSWQRSAACALLGVLGAGCASEDLPPSVWPPDDFACEVEEVALRDGVSQVVRRVRFDHRGLVVYGTATASRVDPVSKVALPVFDRLCAYELVPVCLRAFARNLQRLGVTSIDTVQGERGVSGDTGLVLRWQAFRNVRTIVARGRVHGQMAEILAVVQAHMPNGERLGLPGLDERVVVPVLKAVPEPLADASAALAAHLRFLQQRPDDRSLLLDAFTLACATGARADAEVLLQRWTAAGGGQAVGTFPDEPTGGLDAEILRRL
ncbi:MAG: hypothetical protein JNK15_18490, partial [Planctomycetes bacterium]|nr:hypothetical protein [Planctomycetota bacterium]